MRSTMPTDDTPLTYCCQTCRRRNIATDNLGEDTSCPACGGTCVADKRPPRPSREKLESRRTFSPADLLGDTPIVVPPTDNAPLTDAELAQLSDGDQLHLKGHAWLRGFRPCGHCNALRALARARVDLTAINGAISPVVDWYVDAEHPLRLDELITGIVEDLRNDRRDSLEQQDQLSQVDEVLAAREIAAHDGDYRTALHQLVGVELAIAGHVRSQGAEKSAVVEAENARLREHMTVWSIDKRICLVCRSEGCFAAAPAEREG